MKNVYAPAIAAAVTSGYDLDGATIILRADQCCDPALHDNRSGATSTRRRLYCQSRRAWAGTPGTGALAKTLCRPLSPANRYGAGRYFAAGPSAVPAYTWAETDILRQFAWNPATAQFQTTPFALGSTSAFIPGGFMALSANGSTNGILWAATPYNEPADHQIVAGILHAYNAANVSTELWNSMQNASRDSFGNFAKFSPPMIVNGKVCLSTFSNQLAVLWAAALSGSGSDVQPGSGSL